ncbi:DUF2062 domain-containing protein [Bacillus sp. PS06]|uniref:DUF2062 domain-containing protein n=1 Tax=Bacillus sp. PS06 TaxID=2764176 RepID=UPI001784AD73|nr:DUF2062 domain-containing protein [Bacillus sp. PS06]MBD8067419.1 DUF2062 domain-containing protein [Bacillus sp. PS06]
MLIKLQRRTKLLVLNLLRIKDKAHSIALGFSIGFIINFVPSFGLGPIISTTAARIFRGNAIAGLIGGVLFIWIFPFLFYLNLVIGHLFVPIEMIENEGVLDDTGEVLATGLTIGKAFIVGMFINIVWASILTYYTIYFIINKHRVSLLRFIHKKWNIKSPRT